VRAMHVRHLWRPLTVILLACHPSLPEPARVGQAQSALIQIPYPPPPARVEVVPPQPNSSAVWIDGEWTWTGRRWAWKYGRWVVPPPGAAYSPWVTVRARDATLYFAPGIWRDASGKEVTAPPALAIAKASQENVVASQGETEETGTNVRPEGAQRRPRSAPTSTEPPPALDPGFFGDAGLPGDAGGDAGQPGDGGP